jgi:hypothetical protein
MPSEKNPSGELFLVAIVEMACGHGYESFMVDPDRLDYRDRLGDAAPNTRVLEVREL